VYDNGTEAVALLEESAAEVKQRAARYRGVRRLWARSTGEPFTVLVVDELADLIAYQPDKQLRERAARAIQSITSQGRAPGYAVVGLVQDPRKEVVGFRHLFSTRVALRLDEPQQVDMVLGDGVRERGAAAHEISENTPGVAWVKQDGQREPEGARAFHVTDADLVELGLYLAPATVHDLPTRPEGEGRAAA
jgi:DNA segregation ATPase FtsK/SpoIIIE, S-DNA-T family